MLAGRLVISLTSLCVDGLVDKLLKGEALVQTKITTELGVKSLAEPSLFLGISGHFFWSITCKVSKLPTVSIYNHLALGEIAKLFPLAVYQTF
jgi:hypothetical protein